MSLPTLAANPLPSLADEIMVALRGLIATHPNGPNIKQISEAVSADPASIRKAMAQLNTEARAMLMRRDDSRELFLYPNTKRILGLNICAKCGAGYRRTDKTVSKRCCSRACGISWSWTRPGVKEKRKAGIRAERATPAAKARAAKLNRERWSRPGERERLSEWNKKRWANPAIKADLARAIALVQRTPEMRKLYSDLRKEWWKDPVMREKMLKAMADAHGTPEYRAKHSERMKARWRDPVLRKKYLAAVGRNVKKIAENNRGKRQSPEHVARRMASRRGEASA
jgi:hypothetical protein